VAGLDQTHSTRIVTHGAISLEIPLDMQRDPVPVMRTTPQRILRTAFVGTYPPRQCGIATFTYDLAAAVRSAVPGSERRAVWGRPGSVSRPATTTTDIVAVDYEERDFPSEVRHRLDPDRPSDYLRVADRLNRAAYDIVSLQHEFGIYGGDDGERVLDLLEELEIPVVVTLHTVLRHPSDHQRRVLRAVVRGAARVVVLSQASAATLAAVYDVDPAMIQMIPHGVPDLPFVDPDTVKPLVGLAGRPTVLSFGLLGPGKGYELAIRAMSTVIGQSPDASYVILGATHPELRRREGEAYRESLKTLVGELDLGEHVRFVDAFVDLPTLGRWMQAADVFVTPYPGAEQAVSGTLAYALGTGKALVSTPYAYAEELLADGRGRLVPFGDSKTLGAEIGDFLTDASGRDEARRRAYAYGRRMTWHTVGHQYLDLFGLVATASGSGERARLAERGSGLAAAERDRERTSLG
jgi:glycosyltransferase involved in cell wall biosynthesis